MATAGGLSAPPGCRCTTLVTWSLISVTRGLKPGDQVVTAGQMKLRNGAAVVVNNSFTPANSPDPKPAQS